MQEKSWLETVLDEGITRIQNEQKPVGWFSISAISNIPYIKFPDLTEYQNQELLEQTKNVLRISRNENNYKEVAITYDLNSNSPDKYKKVLGDYKKVSIMDDMQTKLLFDNSIANHNIAIISIHNHPNNTNFSLSDLLVFSENSSIKIMEIVNTKGEVAFLYKPNNIWLQDVIIRTILDIVPDFVGRKETWKQKNSNVSTFSLLNILSIAEMNTIAKESIYAMESLGVVYCNYIDTKTKSNLKFGNNIIEISNSGSLNMCRYNLSEEYSYSENGEDGYEYDEL